MNREDKNQQTKAKIVNSAMLEFARHGYDAGSLNSICRSGGISKGIIYHYFASKDELYLHCIDECFNKLTAYLRKELSSEQLAEGERLSAYFQARIRFFRENPVYACIFTESVIMSPQRLKDEIDVRKSAFNEFNRQYLTELLRATPLREDITVDEVADSLRLFQDYLNMRFRSPDGAMVNMEEHERQCLRALEIFLYGIIKRDV